MTYNDNCIAFPKKSLSDSDFLPSSAFSPSDAEQLVQIIRNNLVTHYRVDRPREGYSAEIDLTAPEDSSTRIYNAIEALYLSHNTPRDRQIADRLTALHRDAIAEDEHILSDSISQFTAFFLRHRDLGFPRITLTPDGTLRARWIHGAGNFTAIEFTGKRIVKLVAEIPRADGLTAQHFSNEPIIENIVSVGKAIGASFEEMT